MDELRDYLNRLEPGSVKEKTHLQALLAQVWDDLRAVIMATWRNTSSSAEWQPDRVAPA